MALPPISEIVTSVIQSRTRKLADNVTDNTALLRRLMAKGKIRPVTGGDVIFQELQYDENSAFSRISGYEPINIGASDIMTAAEYDLKEYVVAVTMSQREMLMDSGREKMIDLLESRIENAEITLMNRLSADLYSDGTADGGKQITGLAAVVPVPSSNILTPTEYASGTYGGINRANFDWWRPLRFRPADILAASYTAADFNARMMDLHVQLRRNNESPDLIVADNAMYTKFWSGLTQLQRFADEKAARLGWAELKFGPMSDVVLDGGVNGSAPNGTMYFLNTKYLMWRPHRSANFRAIEERVAANQLAIVRPLYWAGNLTCSNQRLQGVLASA